MCWLFAQAKAHNVPLVIAGDIFDKAIGDSRFISFIIALFRQCEVPIYAVPGNHDLPYHSYTNMPESAYGILAVTDVIRNIDQTITYRIGIRDITLHGYYWARSFDNPPPFNPDHFNIAVIHKYVYDLNSGYFGVNLAGRYDNQLSTIRHNYDFLIYGDNHTPFHKTASTGSVLINCGSFFRRSQNDKYLKPAAYLLKADRSFTSLHVPLDGQSFLQKDDSSIVSTNLPDYSELSEFFEEQESGIDNLTIQDSFSRFVAVSNTSASVKTCLSRITGLSLG
jgi:DNA repair exonuclease SbcCD nuclease subunit